MLTAPQWPICFRQTESLAGTRGATTCEQHWFFAGSELHPPPRYSRPTRSILRSVFFKVGLLLWIGSLGESPRSKDAHAQIMKNSLTLPYSQRDAEPFLRLETENRAVPDRLAVAEVAGGLYEILRLGLDRPISESLGPSRSFFFAQPFQPILPGAVNALL